MNNTHTQQNSPEEIRKKLIKVAKKLERAPQEIMQFYAMERFLYRLSISFYRERFVLKGGLMFSIWDFDDFRATKDIDFLALVKNQPDYIELIFKEICKIQYDDGVIFNPDSVITNVIQAQNEYHGIQIKFKGNIDRTKVHLRSDIGFSDIVVPKPLFFSFPTILEMPQPNILGYSQESVIAEKMDAMLQLGHLNSRMKDFFDIWHLTKQTSYKLSNLKKALQATLTRRKTQIVGKPSILSPSFGHLPEKEIQWKNFCLQNKLKNAPSFPDLMLTLQVFFTPLLSQSESLSLEGLRWNPDKYIWDRSE